MRLLQFERRGMAVAGVLAASLLVQSLHYVEHIAQVVQKYGLGQPAPRGLLGAAFDTEWVHFLYNGTLLALLVTAVASAGTGIRAWWRAERPLGWTLLVAAVAVQGYHFFEHAVRLAQHLATGVDPAPGVLGRFVDLIWLHFGLNTLVLGLMGGAFVALSAARCPALRPKAWGREALACPLVGPRLTGVVSR